MRRAVDLGIAAGSMALGAAIVLWVAGLWGFAIDALIYHDAWATGLYDAHPIIGEIAGFIYTPAAALLVWPLGLLPRQPYAAAYFAIALAAFAWLLWPLPWRPRALLLALCAWPAAIGNIEWLLAIVVVLGFRYPALYAIPLLTKLSAGAFGVEWFLGRFEWRAAAIAVGTAVLLAAASAVVRPDLWGGWATMLREQTGAFPGGYLYPFWLPQVHYVVRTVASTVLVAWGARTGRPWTLPLAMVIAQPDWHPWTLGILAAVPRLRLRHQNLAGKPGSDAASTSMDVARLPG
jgi:hypothetical protein